MSALLKLLLIVVGLINLYPLVGAISADQIATLYGIEPGSIDATFTSERESTQLMTAYLIVDITVHDLEQYQGYVSAAPEHVARHQGQYIVRGGNATAAEGDWRPERLVVLEFPSRAHAEALLEDPDYQAVAAIRHASTTSRLVIADGYDIA
jgi:uncharacterized protein (DUF1330 family)